MMTFAERVAQLMRAQTDEDVPSMPIWDLNELALDLLSAIREQRAALREAERLYSTRGLVADNKLCGPWITSVRATLAKFDLGDGK